MFKLKPRKAWAVIKGKSRLSDVYLSQSDAKYWAEGRPVLPVWIIKRNPGEKKPPLVEKS